MTDPRILELSVREIQTRLNNVLPPDDSAMIEKALSTLKNNAPVECEEELPDEIDHVLTDAEVQCIRQYVNQVEDVVEEMLEPETTSALDW